MSLTHQYCSMKKPGPEIHVMRDGHLHLHQEQRPASLSSMGWLKGKSAGNHGFSKQIWGFPIDFTFNQSNDVRVTLDFRSFWWWSCMTNPTHAGGYNFYSVDHVKLAPIICVLQTPGKMVQTGLSKKVFPNKL